MAHQPLGPAAHARQGAPRAAAAFVVQLGPRLAALAAVGPIAAVDLLAAEADRVLGDAVEHAEAIFEADVVAGPLPFPRMRDADAALAALEEAGFAVVSLLPRGGK